MKRFMTITMMLAALLLAGIPASAAAEWPQVRQGASGSSVQAIQHLLTARGFATTADSQYGPATTSRVRSFQTSRGLAVDGWIGGQTWPVLVISVRQGSTVSAVRAAQVMLRSKGYGVTVDGRFGSQTNTAVRDFQSRNGLTVDGLVGRVTWRHLVGTSSGGGGGTGGSYSEPLPAGTVSRGGLRGPALERHPCRRPDRPGGNPGPAHLGLHRLNHRWHVDRRPVPWCISPAAGCSR